MINEKFEGGYKRIYVLEKVGLKDKELLHLLRQDVPCKILIFLFNHMVCSQIEFSKELEKRPSTIEFHLKKLIDMDIIEPAPIEKGVVRRLRDSCFVDRSLVKNEVIYRIKYADIGKNIHKPIVKYGDSLPDQNTIAPLIKDIKEMDMSTVVPNRVNNASGAIGSVFETLYEIFPHPYHV